jgi:shikimate dehydrogenase
MKKYISLSSHPGTQGKYYYTEFFKLLGIAAVYEPIGTDDLGASIEQALREGVSGISVSMPFKEKIISYLDIVDPLVAEYYSCNTIVINNGKLHGYNCDYAGAKQVLSYIDPTWTVSILGSGSMGTMIANMLPERKVYALRNGSWEYRHNPADVFINCTNRGTVSKASPLSYIPRDTKLVIDLAINPGELAEQCAATGTKYVAGQEFYKYQFLDQFEKYFDQRPSSDSYDTIRNNRT